MDHVYFVYSFVQRFLFLIKGFDYNFEKFDENMINSYGVPYDFGSILHYSPTAFAKERGLVTITAKGNRDVKFGQRDGLSDYDVKQARAMYNCEDTDFEATPIATTENTIETLSTKEPTTVEQTRPITEKQTENPTTPTSTTKSPTTILPSTTEKRTNSVKTEGPSTNPPSTEIQTDPSTTEKPLTQEATTKKQTDAVTTARRSTNLPTTKEQLASSTLLPSTNPNGGKDKGKLLWNIYIVLVNL